MLQIRHFHLLMVTCAASVVLAACSGPNPNMGRERLKNAMQPNTDTQKVLEELNGPNVGSVEDALAHNAEQAMANGQYKNAAQMYGQLVQKKPEEKKYQLAMADAMRRSGMYDEAAIQYKKLENDKQYGLDAKEGLGLSYLEDGEFDRAGDELAVVMEKDPKRWRTVNGIGILFTTKQMYPEARQYFQEATSLAPDNVSVKNNLALLEALDKNYPESIRIFTEAARQVGKRGEDRKKIDMNLALVYAITGDLDMAEATVKPHLNDAQRMNNMSYYAELQGDDALAKSYLNMALTKSDKYYEKAWKNLETLNTLKQNAPKKR